MGRGFLKFSLRPMSLEEWVKVNRQQAVYREHPMIIAYDNFPGEKRKAHWISWGLDTKYAFTL